MLIDPNCRERFMLRPTVACRVHRIS